MRTNDIHIHDLYEGAFLLCRGLDLKDLTITGTNGKKLVTFIFSGNAAQRASQLYRRGKATANVAMLKFTMEKLKDRMFEKIREKEREERTNAAPYFQRAHRAH